MFIYIYQIALVSSIKQKTSEILKTVANHKIMDKVIRVNWTQ